jgi:hypothetical protein
MVRLATVDACLETGSTGDPASRLIPSEAQKVACRWRILTGLFLTTGIACTDSLGPEDEPAGPSGRIVFVSDRSGAVSASGAALSDIYRTNGDGTGLENFTKYPAQVYRDLRLSPDGGWIAFESDRSGQWHICAVKPDGTKLWQITNGSANDWNAIWVGGE